MMKIVKSESDSVEQRVAEEWLVSKLSDELGIRLTKERFNLPESSWIEVDGCYKSPFVLCEVSAHIGIQKPAQKYKIITDALKLLYVNSLKRDRGESRLILLFADKKAAMHFQGKSWMAQCLRKYDIEIKVIELAKEIKDKVKKAQKRQKSVFIDRGYLKDEGSGISAISQSKI